MSTLSVPEIHFPLNIPAISKLTYVYSPEFLVQGIPWKVCVWKNDTTESLAIFLACTIKDNSSWSHVASAEFMLRSFNENRSPVVHIMSPCVFTQRSGKYGFNSMIEWKSLLDPNNGYINNDTVVLDIKIKVVEPHDLKASRLVFHKTKGCCQEASVATFRLRVENVNALMAVKSPLFVQRNIPCEFLVRKRALDNGKCMCCVALYVNDLDYETKIQETLCTLNFKLVSKTNVFKEHMRMGYIKSCSSITIEFIEWDQLFHAQNGFVNDNGIVIEVEVKFGDVKKAIPVKQTTSTQTEANRPDVMKVAVKRQTAATQTEEKRPRFECSICKEDIDRQSISSTVCGHLFCTACIEVAVRARKLCPICNRRITAKSLRRAFLSSVDDD